MKNTSLLIGACLVSVLTGCHKPQASNVIGEAEATIKSTALAAITAKYPNLSSSDLEFVDITIAKRPQVPVGIKGTDIIKGAEGIIVNYSIPASATPDTKLSGANVKISTVKVIIVSMSPSGKVEELSEHTMKVVGK